MANSLSGCLKLTEGFYFFLILTAMLFFSSGISAAVVAGTTPADIPKLRVPKMKTPPNIDGKLDSGEWHGAAAISALTGGAERTIAPPVQQVTFYLGYDDKYLYLAMHSPHQEGVYPQARCKTNDDMTVLFDDHIEVQIASDDRAQAKQPGFGFFKMMANPRGAVIDQSQRVQTGGSISFDNRWSTGGKIKCTVTPTYWDLEMSIERSQMKLDTFDGRSLVVWLCRSDSCGGSYFLTWGPGAWTGWDTMPEVTFDPAAPAVQLATVGNIMEGSPDMVFNLSDIAGKAHTIAGSLKILNKAGQPVCDEKATAEVAANGHASLRLAKTGVPLDDVGNTVFLEVKEGNTVLWSNKMPLTRLTEAYRKTSLDPWLKRRPQSSDWGCMVANRPGGLIECGVDLDRFGMREAVLKANACEVEIMDDEGQSVVKDRFAIVEKGGSILLKAPGLAESDGKARFTLYEGEKRLAEKQLPSLRQAISISDYESQRNDETNDRWHPFLAEEVTGGREVDTYHPNIRPSWGYEPQVNSFPFYVVHPRTDGKSRPLNIVLHSAGHDAWTMLQTGFSLSPDGARESLFYTPDDSYGLYLQGDGWWGANVPTGADPKQYAAKDTPVEKRVLDTIAWVMAKYDIDPNRVYLSGLSMGGTGALGIGMRHGELFAAIQVAVPAGVSHVSRKMYFGETIPADQVIPDPPVVVDMSAQNDVVSKGHEALIKAAIDRKYALIFGWGPFGHDGTRGTLSRYCAPVLAVPWREIRRNEAYPVFTGATSDQKPPWPKADGADETGQMNAYFRWKNLEDTATDFSMRLWIGPTANAAAVRESVADITFRRLQQFKVPAGKDVAFELVRDGKTVSTGTIQPDAAGLLTIPRQTITTVPAELRLKIK